MDNCDNKPHPRMSAYAFFVLACQEEQEKHPEESVGSDEFWESCTDRWQTMSEQGKRRFYQMAEKDKIRYASEMSNYKPGEEEKAPVRKRRTKNPNVPKRPLVAFFWFAREERPKVKELMPDAAFNEVIAEVSRRWNSISTETKAKYDALAAEDEARYQKELKAYKEAARPSAPSDEKPLTSPVDNLSCSIGSEPGTNSANNNMPNWLQRKPSAIQEQPLVSKYGDQFDTYPDDAAEKDNRKLSNQTDGPKDEQPETCFDKNFSLYKGLFYSSMSSVFFSLSSVIVKYVKDISPGELAVLRFVGILIFTLPLVIYSREQPFGPRPIRHLLIFRGLVGATSLFLRFVAFQNLPIADASVIIFSIPVFVAVLARIFLKEPCGFFHAFTVLLTLLGIVLITKLPLILADEIAKYSKSHFFGVGAALGSTLFGASVYVVIRKMTAVHHSVIMFNFGWVAIIETVCLTFLTGDFVAPTCGLEQWLVILLGIFSFCGQMLLTMALKTEHASPVAIVRAATDIVLAFFWQIWFFHEIPDAYSISGAVLVSSCVVLISIRKWVMTLPEHSSIRKRAYLLTI